MRSFAGQLGLYFFMIALISFMIVMAMNPGVLSNSIPALSSEGLQSFKTMFISIVLEALPFLLLGVLVSSFMQAYISERMIQRFIPKNIFVGLIFACGLGIIFPVCECGLIPIIRRLIAKGMPLYVGIVFIFVGPIVNPIVYAATYTAFRTRPELLYSRMGLAILVGVFVGLVVHYFVKKNPMKTTAPQPIAAGDSGHTHSHAHHHHDHQHHHQGGRFQTMLDHASNEFFDMGKYLMFGIMITAAIQTFVPRGDLASIGQGELSSHLFMMGFAYILSICSTSDAFVAASFVSTFSLGSLLTFLVYGPMLDLKSTLMLLSVFKARFVLFLIALVSVGVLVGAFLIGKFYL